MNWSARLLRDSNLYLILDREVNGYDELFEIARQAFAGGVRVMQLRDKKGLAKDIVQFSKKILKFFKNRIVYIVNDRVDLALAAGAHGVHLGQDDLSIAAARKMVGQKAVIGASCQSFSHAKKAEVQGADYIGFGSVFKTLTKPGRRPTDLSILSEAVREIGIPVFAIGGINLDNVRKLNARGVQRVAVCRAICNAGDVKRATKSFIDILR